MMQMTTNEILKVKSSIWYPESIWLLKVDSDAALLPSWF